MKTKRPPVLIMAMILMILASLCMGLTSFLPDKGSDPGSPVMAYGSVVLGVLGLAAAFGLWNIRRWAMWLSISVSVLMALLAAGGIAFAASPLIKGLATVLVVLNVLTVVCVVLPSARQAYVSERVRATQ